jgi:hypothetical protein
VSFYFYLTFCKDGANAAALVNSEAIKAIFMVKQGIKRCAQTKQRWPRDLSVQPVAEEEKWRET